MALEDTDVCVMPYSLIESMGREYLALTRHIHALLAREIVRTRDMMLVLGSMRAPERLAVFLSDLSRRFVACGQSCSEFHLPMTRRDIASYLGMKLETLSRLFGRFQSEGLIRVKSRHVRLLDRSA